MEDSNPSKSIPIIYFINNDSEGNKLKIEIEEDINFLSYEMIKNKFFQSLQNLINKEIEIESYTDNSDFDEYNLSNLQYENIIFDYMRYFENGCWLFLEKNEFIFLDDINTLQLMIKLTIFSEDKIKIKQMYEKTAERINEMSNEIADLSKEQYKDKKDDICVNNNMDLVVLTSNPLMHFDKEKKLELRTMNDFNRIPYLIHEAIKDPLNSISAEFCPLTKSKFIDVLSKKEYKPTILHLIFKSTYDLDGNDDIPEGKESSDFVKLIFETEDYNAEFIDKESLQEIIKKNEDIKNNIKEINLIISTQLAQDVFKIFDQFGFKNILVQHTTLTDVEYISDFNYTFYTDIICSDFQNIKDLFEDALNPYIIPEYGNIFCCCFHSHTKIKGKTCKFMKNLKNELYYDKKEKKLSKENIEQMLETIPHFCHLRMNERNNYDYIDDFCIMNKHIYIKFNTNLKIKYKKCEEKKNFYNICCCEKEKHNLKEIFFENFNEKKVNNDNLSIQFRGKLKTQGKKYIPDFSKLCLLVGKNKIVYEVINYIKENVKFKINIYPKNNEYSEYDLNELANVIIEYIKERTENGDEDEDETQTEKFKLNKNISFSSLKNNLISESLGLKSIKSTPNLQLNFNTKIHYLLFDFNTSDSDKFVKNDFSDLNNKIYFIIAENKNETKLLKEFEAKMNKMVIFSLKEIDKNELEINKYFKIKSLTEFNKYVKGQLKEVENALLN